MKTNLFFVFSKCWVYVLVHRLSTPCASFFSICLMSFIIPISLISSFLKFISCYKKHWTSHDIGCIAKIFQVVLVLNILLSVLELAWMNCTFLKGSVCCESCQKHFWSCLIIIFLLKDILFSFILLVRDISLQHFRLLLLLTDAGLSAIVILCPTWQMKRVTVSVCVCMRARWELHFRSNWIDV